MVRSVYGSASTRERPSSARKATSDTTSTVLPSTEHARHVEAARAAVGERAWQKAKAEGSELDFDAALGLASSLHPAILAAAE
jgi:hypothetical protein